MGKYRPRDHFFQRAKREGLAARSAYKLEEIQRKHRLLRRGDQVLDLGASPGSWTQIASAAVGTGGRVVAVDKSPLKISVPKNVDALTADVFEISPDRLRERIENREFDVVISDMAPATCGDRFVDQQRSANLCERALELAREVLRRGGHFVAKALEGESTAEVRDALRAEFDQVRTMRPQSTRKGSTEVFLIGLGWRPKEE